MSTATGPATVDNPLLTPSPLPHQAPRFDAISNYDFRPAFEESTRLHLAELDAIINDPSEPTFENTLVALERSGQALMRVASIFNVLTSANTNDVLQRLQQDIAPRLAAHDDAIRLNPALFRRIEILYGRRDSLGLDEESRKLLEVHYQRFVRAGARLSDTDKDVLRQLNEEEAALGATFITRLLDATRDGAIIVDDPGDLEGLSEAEMADAAATAASRGQGGRWVLTLGNTTQQSLLRSLRQRTIRERLFTASRTRTSKADANDTTDTIVRLAEIRAQRAALLGQPNHAAWRLQNQMAKTPDRVQGFLAQLVPPARAKAITEHDELRTLMRAEDPDARLEPWDWLFFAERVRQSTYDLSSAELAPYFELDRVMQDGVFYVAQQLYGLSFSERHDLPVYHPDVRVFDVLDEGSHLGLFYVDFFRRDNKNGGAWMDNLLPQSTLIDTRPIICNVLNLARPAHGQPALLSLEDVLTLFHEFGHALHGLFASQRYVTLSGTSVARDFVELPSLFNERWAFEPEVLRHYARHYQTGEPIPQSLAGKIAKATTFNQGYALSELLAATSLDLEWHSVAGALPTRDVDRFEQDALRSAQLDLEAIPPRYHSPYFLHIWANGYDAGYYAYLWAEMLAHDAFAWFTEHGGLTRANGQHFRECVLSRGNTRDYDEMYLAFRGREPRIEPMLEFRGVKKS